MNSIVHLPSMIWINRAAASIFRHPSFRFHCNNRLSSEWHLAFTGTYKWARIRNAVNKNNIIKCFFFVNSYNLRMITHGSRVQKFECTRMIMSPMINGGARVSTIKCMKFICGESSYNIRSGRSWALQKSTFWNPRNMICSSAAEMLIRHCCEPISPLIWQIIILVCIVSMTYANITMSLTVMVIDRIRHQETYNLNRNIENKIRKCKVHIYPNILDIYSIVLWVKVCAHRFVYFRSAHVVQQYAIRGRCALMWIVVVSLFFTNLYNASWMYFWVACNTTQSVAKAFCRRW